MLPLKTAWIAWMAATLPVYLWAARISFPMRGWLLLALAYPAVFVNFAHGQNGFLIAGLLAGGVLMLDRRPLLAGVLFGMLTLKPHFGLLIPIVLLATGRWRTIAAACATTLLLCGVATLAFGANALLVAGSEAQKQEWLPKIAEGACTATLAMTEPNGRWDARGIEATLARDGDAFVLRGTKRYVVDGHAAELLVVAARTPGSAGEQGVSLALVPADAAGVERKALPTVDQTRRQAEIAFHDVRVPADALLGAEGAAWPALSRVLDLAAVALAAEQVGGAQRALDLAVAYAKERVQFGRVIGSFQAIKHKCADMMVAVEAARSGLYLAACAAAEGTDDLPRMASLAKAYCSDAYFRCAADDIQIHGGVGFTWEYDCHLHFKRAKSSETLLGDAAHHRELVARRIGL